MKKPGIPAVNVADQRVASLLQPMKQNIEQLTGVRGGPLTQLPSDASLAEVISKINAIIVRLNA
jgi:Tfp pilus assembly protein PilO